jgi:GAF domain-containing protein
VPSSPHTDGVQAAPLPAGESQRLAALHQYRLLDTLPEAVYDDLAFIASQICQTPIALVSLIDEHRQWFKAKIGLEATETPRDIAFCAHAILDPNAVMQVPDTRLDERFARNPLVTSAPGIRFYAGVPLVTPGGHAIGTLCAIDQRPRQLSDDQLRALRALAREVMVQVELRWTIATLERELSTARSGSRASPPRDADDRLRAMLQRMQQLQQRPR